jgi:hypothetical protein
MHLQIKTYFTSISTRAWLNAVTMLNLTRLGIYNHTDHPPLSYYTTWASKPRTMYPRPPTVPTSRPIRLPSSPPPGLHFLLSSRIQPNGLSHHCAKRLLFHYGRLPSLGQSPWQRLGYGRHRTLPHLPRLILSWSTTSHVRTWP